MSIARGIATSIVGPIAGGRGDGDPTLTLHHDYTRSGYAVVGPSLTFSRASTATYFDSDGVMQTAAIDAMRKQSHVYEGGAWVNKGLLVEGQATNLSIYSSDLTAFTQQNSNITSNADTAPDGSNDFDLLIPTVTNATHTAFRTGVLFSTTTSYTWSIYAKSGGYTHLQLLYGVGFNNANAWCNFVLSGDGSIGSKGTGTTGTITHMGDGVYRCEMVATSGGAAGSSGHAFSVLPSDLASLNPSFAANGTSGVYLWGSQLETGSFATSHIPTTASAVTRSADVATIGGTDFSGFYNASEGTWVVESELPSVENASVLYINNGSVEESLRIGMATSGNVLAYSRSSAVTDGTVNSGAYSSGLNSIAVGYANNDLALSRNGESVVSDLSVAVPVGIDRMTVGRGASIYLNGHIKSLKYYNVRKPNAFLKGITS